MTKLLESLFFADNPFANYSAENEPAIDQYFVRPPYYEFVKERGVSCRSVVLFGARGAGKSATRLTFAKEAWLPPKDGQMRPLPVVFDDFSRVLANGLERISLRDFVAEAGYLVIESLLLWLATEPEEDRKLILGTLTDAEEATLISLVQHFYLTRPDFLRHASVREPLKLLQQAWHKRAKLWFGERWDGLSSLVASIAQALGNKWAGTSANLESGLSALLKADREQWNEAHFARALLSRFVDLTRYFGFSGVTMLIDKADETDQTSNSAGATAKLLYPILANTQLLEIDGFGWLLFLWDKVRDEYSSSALPVRLDKIANAIITWDERFLVNLCERRLSHFSGGRVGTFAALCEPEVAAESAFSDVVRTSMKSPREVIRILDTVVREHDDEFAHLEESRLLKMVSIEKALDKYAVDAVRRTFSHVQVGQLVRMKLTTFINNDVQQAFRINAASARNRIRAWIDAGIVSQTGTRQAEGGGAGKPSNEYSVTDLRVRRILERHIPLGDELDFDEGTDESAGAG
jgi:hypothetical protein